MMRILVSSWKFARMLAASRSLRACWEFVEIMLSAGREKVGAQGRVSSRLVEDGRRKGKYCTKGIPKGMSQFCFRW